MFTEAVISAAVHLLPGVVVVVVVVVIFLHLADHILPLPSFFLLATFRWCPPSTAYLC